MKTNTKLLLAAGAAVAWLLLKKNSSVSGVGKVERIKRRIYKEVSLAQQAGVDFSKKFAELTPAEIEALENVAHEVGWKQTKRAQEKGTPFAESYYNSLRRAWNAVSGVRGIGTTYDVKNANGQVVLRWIEDAEKHYEREAATLEAERRAAEARKRLRNMRRTTTPLALVQNKTKQQQILEKVPYLKVMDDPFHPVSNSANFNYVLWVTAKSPDGNVMYEGAKMAFTGKQYAEDAKNFLKGNFRDIKSDVWNEYLEQKMADQSWWKYHKDFDDRLEVKEVQKVNVDKISGLADF